MNGDRGRKKQANCSSIVKNVKPLIIFLIVYLYTRSLSGCASQEKLIYKQKQPQPQPVEQPEAIVEPETEYPLEYEIAPWYGFRSAACSITFDDGTLDQFLVGFPELETRHIRATFFIITAPRDVGVWNDSGTKRILFSWHQARILALAGHEIASHSQTHVDLTQEGALVEDELRDSAAKLKAEIPQAPGLVFGWPYWRSTESSRTIAKKYFIAARSGSGLVKQYLEKNGGIPKKSPDDFFQINSLGFHTSDTPASWQLVGEKALSQGGWIIVSFHGIDNGRLPKDALGWQAMPVKTFSSILDYIQHKDFWVAPFGKVYRYIRERDQAKLSARTYKKEKLRVAITTELDTSVYDQPLTVKIRLPSKWERVTVSQGDRILEHVSSDDGYIVIDAIPGQSDIIIEKRS
ncbi:MAG: polysaccharide deacetylase family protein [Spirochaetota bacterium]